MDNSNQQRQQHAASESSTEHYHESENKPVNETPKQADRQLHEHVSVPSNHLAEQDEDQERYAYESTDKSNLDRQVFSKDEPDNDHRANTGAQVNEQPRDTTYRNNLLWTVGLLEWSNAMDFPANIFNQVPVPLFAQVLMGLGGSIAILWSIFPFWDMHRSLNNIRLLREERRFLQRWRQDFGEADTMHTRHLVNATLDVNLRELGWELIDRVFMDICAGISGLLVGAGALMAIRGEDRDIFLASNLLSGYIGNSFLAPFALANSAWAVFMWKRASVERRFVKQAGAKINDALQARMAAHGRKHRLYALLNGSTAVIGTVGSIMSATLWYGYVVIAPCVFTLLFCNLFWRYKLGYNRSVVLNKKELEELDIERVLLSSLALDDAMLERNPVHKSSSVKLDQSSKHSDKAPKAALVSPTHVDSGLTISESLLEKENGSAGRMAESAQQDLSKKQRRVLRDQQRYLLEVYGRFIRQLDHSYSDVNAGQDYGTPSR